MANEQNLRPGEYKLSLEEAKKGGIASGEARRKKKSWAQQIELLMSLPVKTKNTKEILDTLGIEDNEQNNLMAMNVAMYQQALKGNVSAYNTLRDSSGNNYQDIIIQGSSEKEDLIVVLPCKDVASSFSDINRMIDDREYREYYLEGGRGSTKSSFISEKIIELLENNPRMCAVVLRKVKDTLKDSVYAQLEWALDTLGETYPHIKTDYKLTKSPLEITKLSTGQKIFFRGADDYGKIKSLKPPKDMYIGITWYEEFDQFAGMNEVRKINQSLIRGGDDFIQFYSYNTPASTQHFVNIEKIIPKDTRIVHLSDYTKVPKKWLGQAFIDEAEFLKSINEKLYQNEYLGLMTGTGGNVFENVELREITDEEISHFDSNYYGLDFGWVDPVAFDGMYYNPNRKELYIYEEFHDSKISNEKLGEMLEPWKDEIITCDSAEPKSIGDLKAFGYMARGAIKGPGSIEYSMKWLASLSKIIIDQKRCPYTATEFLNYEFEQDKDGNYISSYPDGNDHHISAVRYAMEQVWKKKGM